MGSWSNVFQKDGINRRVARRGGFSLVELLVAVSILLMLMGLILGWFAGASARQGRRSTQSAMASLLVAMDILNSKSPILPDHRLANYVWIQPHQSGAQGTPTWAAHPDARQMSSVEFFVFLSAMDPQTDKMIQSLASGHLKPSPVPGTWGAPPTTGFLVDVFMQYPAAAGALDKHEIGPPSAALPAASYGLMSGPGGHPLRSVVDAWGNEMIYRFHTDKTELNLADGEHAGARSTFTVIEKVARDEQVTRERYRTLGEPVSAAVEYVRPAVSAYAFPAFASAGKDGLWGRFMEVKDASGAAELTRDARNADQDACRDAKAKDNLYSQEENS